MAKFWHSPWLNGWKPKDIASAIFLISKRKNSTVRDALGDLAWIARIDMSNSLSINHIQQLYTLWAKLDLIQLHEDVPDAITWNITTDRVYSEASAYKVQSKGTIPTTRVLTV